MRLSVSPAFLACLAVGLAQRPSSGQDAQAISGAVEPRGGTRELRAPVVVGLAGSRLPPRVRGLVLLGELGCAGCHPDDVPGAVEPRIGSDLATVGRRVRATYLARFLADPRSVEPGTVMPDLLRGRGDAKGSATALAHYLRSFAGAVTTTSAAAPVTTSVSAKDVTERGRALFHSIGCVACHPPRGPMGAETDAPATVSLAHVGAKYEPGALHAFLLAPHLAHPGRRMPDLHLSPSEAFDLSRYLLPGTEGEPRSRGTDAVDPASVEVGRALFAELGCARCHALSDARRAPSPGAAPLRALDPTRGCLSDQAGAVPDYTLTSEQRADLRAALAALGEPLDDEARIQQSLAARGCTACHERNGLGGASPALDAMCTTDEPGLGADGRLPPTLTGVGAKLQAEWLADAIAQGQRERPYLHTRMPGFGAACGVELAALFSRTDTLPALEVRPLPSDEEAARAVRDLGRELVGDQGMNCVACHRFAGEQAGAMGAIDLAFSTGRRLQAQWFAHFLRAPTRFKPNTLMPQFFPDGVSVRPALGGGDAARQIDAMWHYLAEGRNVRKPSGMRPPPIELAVRDEAVLLRRSVQHTGKRGIAVGYPHGVALTFDAERLGIDQIWWGRFLDAAPVWTAQGSGEARILGKDCVELPPGPAIVALPDADAAWPTATRRELGQRWLGYDLDAEQRPSFRYVAAGVEVTDTPREVVDGADPKARAVLRRTLEFVATKEWRASAGALWFRAARAPRVEDRGGGVVQVGAVLCLSLGDASFHVHADGDARELRVAVPLRAGRAELVVDYAWSGAGR